jgi:uncharacterized delta-60 repeat protein
MHRVSLDLEHGSGTARQPAAMTQTKRMRTTRRTIPLGVLASLALVATAAATTPGDLDPVFGNGGIVTTEFGLGLNGVSNDEGRAAELQPDGKIVVAGTSFFVGPGQTPGQDVIVARYDTHGSLDPSFGSDGKVATSIGSDFSRGHDLALQPDGKIIVAGIVYFGADPNTDVDFGLARYAPDGSLDPDFGTGGMLTTDLGSTFDYGQAVALQPDGKIIVAGATVVAGFGLSWALVRYNADGSLDGSFGSEGKAVSSVIGSIAAVDVQSDGRIVAVGDAFGDLGLVRYNPDGSLDASFGNAGLVRTDAGGEDSFADVTVLPDGKMVAVGTSIRFGTPVTFSFELARYQPDGTLDGTFGTGGRVTTSFGGVREYASAVVVQPDGKIVVAGATGTSDVALDFAVARYAPDGSPDTSFGVGGKTTTDFAGSVDAAFALLLQPDGKLVAAGVATVAFREDFALARYQGDSATRVPIDIKPGDAANRIRLSSKAIPVAILSSSSFDASSVNPGSACFGDVESPGERDCTAVRDGVRDVDGDGLADLVLSFETRQTGIDRRDTQACLTGETQAGIRIEGCDTVVVK